MEIKEIIELVLLGCAIIGLISTIVTSIAKGKLKEFIIKKMEEAEVKYTKGIDRLKYVIEEVKREYKLATLFIDVKKFVEKIIDISKKINSKGE